MHFSSDRVFSNGGESMKKSILMLFVAALALCAIADSVSPEMAIAAANAWTAKNAPFGAGSATTGEVLTERDANGVVLWHQVSMKGGGMLVVAPVTEIEPIVVALDNNPGKLPTAHPLRGILSGDMRRRLDFLGLYKIPSSGPSLQSMSLKPPVSEEAQSWGESGKAKWARLGVGRGPSLQEAAGVGVNDITIEVCTVKGFEKGGVLTHWNQSSYNNVPLYNMYTPHGAVCGCVATACAALAQFYGTTNAVAGVAGNCSYNKQPYPAETRGGSIDWSILPENWGGTNAVSKTLTEEQRDLIGRVAFDAGVGVDMMWTDKESGAMEGNIAKALRNVFGFKNARHVVLSSSANPKQEELEKLIYNQCRAGVPVGMGIEGHSVVAVGYGFDADNVERVRVFMGWAGSGDGWYALPKIDTTATVGGSSYLSEVVDDVITMISYDDDDIVPVVGHVSMPGASLEIPALNRQFESNGYGYFGTRVPPTLSASDCVVTCMGKEAPFAIGADAAEATKSDTLCPALPDAFEFSLLNCTVAYSLEEAKKKALAEGKAILRVSGTSGETNTAVVLDYIYSLDTDNVNDFTNRFVYYFSSYGSKAGDGNPSYGVYLPQILDSNGRWQYANGTLAYGYSGTRDTETRVKSEDSDEYEGETTTEAVTFTSAPFGEGVYEYNSVDEVETTQERLLASLQQVIEIGWTEFENNTSGIELTIATDDPNVDWCTTTPKIGTYTTGYANEQTVVCTAEGTSTNAAEGIVLGVVGWSLTNATTGDVLEGEGTTAEFAVASNETYVLTWSIATNAVYISIVGEALDGSAGGEVSPSGGAWYPYGKPVQFTATADEEEGYVFGCWTRVGEDSNQDLPDSVVVPMGNVLWTDATVPFAARATFHSVYGDIPPMTTDTKKLSVVSYELAPKYNQDGEFAGYWASPLAQGVVPPETAVVGVPGFSASIADGCTNDVPAVQSLGAVMSKTLFTDTTATPTNWVCVGYVLDALNDEFVVTEQTAVELNLSTGDRTVSWFWMRTDEAPAEEDVELPELVIDWNDDLNNLETDYATNLVSRAQLEASGLSLEELKAKISCPTGWVANVSQDNDGNVVVTLAMDEAALAPVAAEGSAAPITIMANGDGTLTVSANVANGLRGFWYSIYAADDLAGTWSLVNSREYVKGEGEPTEQATSTGELKVEIKVDPSDSKKFYKLVVTDKKPESIKF